MRKNLFLVVVFCMALASHAQAYDVSHRNETSTLDRSMYFEKNFSDELDNDGSKKRVRVMVLVSPSRSPEWNRRVYSLLDRSAEDAGWRKVDYLDILHDKMMEEKKRGNIQMANAMDRLISKLKRLTGRNGEITKEDVEISIKDLMVEPGTSSLGYGPGDNSLLGELDIFRKYFIEENEKRPDAVVELEKESLIRTTYMVGGNPKALYYNGSAKDHFVELFKKIGRRLSNDGYMEDDDIERIEQQEKRRFARPRH